MLRECSFCGFANSCSKVKKNGCCPGLFFFKNKIQYPPNISIKLVTDDGMGSQYIYPEKVEIEDNGDITVVVKAWR